MEASPIAAAVDRANDQHYEVPADFFEAVLGPRLKYSCARYDHPGATLAEAEDAALARTARHADLVDGQRILELGCGWGSLSLWMAEMFPASRVVAVSNSASQREFVEARAAGRGLRNLRVVTADVNRFETTERFDRVVSVEMFEHVRNWDALLARVRDWLGPEGRLFLHVFAHVREATFYSTDGPGDWMGRHFFTGGMMPSRDLPHRFPHRFVVEDEWWWDGTHYARTADAWLRNLDHARESVERRVGARAFRRWRMFFLACRELFGRRGGETWGVGHYRLRAPEE
ncbi:MAG: class I SAM-dependent methyltransferase [Gemmatimonadetes bacterium]|nr:class I SAM-dependent methyltransferase [Gemmatimonadota bacterium]